MGDALPGRALGGEAGPLGAGALQAVVDRERDKAATGPLGPGFGQMQQRQRVAAAGERERDRRLGRTVQEAGEGVRRLERMPLRAAQLAWHPASPLSWSTPVRTAAPAFG